MRQKLLLVGLIVGLCSVGQAQSSNTKGQGQTTPTTQGQEKTNGSSQDRSGQGNSPNPARGQNGQGQNATTGSEQANVSSITGCLQRGTAAGSYTITGSDGKKHDIKTSDGSIKMDDHVGHRVTVKTGSENAGDRASTTNRGAGETGDLNVTSLTMVSNSCQ